MCKKWKMWQKKLMFRSKYRRQHSFILWGALYFFPTRCHCLFWLCAPDATSWKPWTQERKPFHVCWDSWDGLKLYTHKFWPWRILLLSVRFGRLVLSWSENLNGVWMCSYLTSRIQSGNLAQCICCDWGGIRPGQLGSVWLISLTKSRHWFKH